MDLLADLCSKEQYEVSEIPHTWKFLAQAQPLQLSAT